MNKFVKRESAAHFMAKEKLASMIREGSVLPFNRTPTHSRVYTEVPLAWKNGRYERRVDERLPMVHVKERGAGWDVNELHRAGYSVDAVLDVAIIFRGFLMVGFEVVWKHPVSADKARILDIATSNEGLLACYEVNARDVLDCGGTFDVIKKASRFWRAPDQ